MSIVKKSIIKIIKNVFIVLICTIAINMALNILQPQLNVLLFKHQVNNASQVFYEFIKSSYYGSGIKLYFNIIICIGLLIYISKSTFDIYKLIRENKKMNK